MSRRVRIRNRVASKTGIRKRKSSDVQTKKPFQQKVSMYTKALKELEPNERINEQLLSATAKACSPALYKRNASVVATSRKSELIRVKENFLIKRMGLEDSPSLDKAIEEVVEVFGTSHPRKYRAMFYYLSAKKLGIQEKLINPINSTETNKIFRSNLTSFGADFINEQEDIDPGIMQVVDSNFFELI